MLLLLAHQISLVQLSRLQAREKFEYPQTSSRLKAITQFMSIFFKERTILRASWMIAKIQPSYHLCFNVDIHTYRSIRRTHTSLLCRTQTQTAQAVLYSNSNNSNSNNFFVNNNSYSTALKQELQLPTAYDPSSNAAYWSLRPVSVVNRTVQIMFQFAGFLLRTRLGMNYGGDDAVDLRHMLTMLGPAFVKIGQAVSARPDILPPKYLKELEKLQDRLPAFPDDVAFQVVKEELSKPIYDDFTNISNGPIAAASLGQVYKAVLRSSGAQVAIKVQRPGVLEQISLDILILRKLFKYIRKWRKFNTDLPAAMDEWAANLYREMDYRQEAAHAIEFRSLYMRKIPQIYVPKVYSEQTTRKILVMEWIEGERLDGDLNLVEVGVRCSLEQILGEGFYHADPHPGNLLRTSDGRLAYLDFGMMGRTTYQMRQALIRTPIYMVNGEIEALAHDFVVLGFLPPGTNVPELVPALTGLFKRALKHGVSNLSFGNLSVDLGKTLYKYKFRLPPYYTLLVRSLTVLEGIALNADPNFKVLSAAYPWLARRVLIDQSPDLQKTLKALLYKDSQFQFQRLADLLEQASRSPGQSSLYQSSINSNSQSTAIVKRQSDGKALLLLLSDQGALLREILIDELAKGLDAAWRISVDRTVAQIRTNPGNNLARVLLTFPTLANHDDVAQVEGIVMLSQYVRQLAQEYEKQQLGGQDAQSNHSMNEGAQILQWLGREMISLPASARQQAAHIPIGIIQKLSSRLAARALRALVTQR
eukprot:TRINITY_DN11966_c0_g2_i1.p1 TRINITY_DN11966_c0_g2~~TRINITY_DN11966_c0_g2_i1.p1  ORF type:complete len:770 (-),score=83.05 TRINITY_DN11966_c0_g2_i1:456-2732(-)